MIGQNLQDFMFNGNTSQGFVGGRVTYHQQKAPNNSRSSVLPKPYVHSNMKVYSDEMARLIGKKEMIQQDDHFIKKMDEFNSYINNQRQQMHMEKLKQISKVNSSDAMILSPRKLELLHHEMGRLMSKLPGGQSLQKDKKPHI